MKFWKKITTDTVSPEGCTWGQPRWLEGLRLVQLVLPTRAAQQEPEAGAGAPSPPPSVTTWQHQPLDLAAPARTPSFLCSPQLLCAFVCLCLHLCVCLSWEHRFQCQTGRAGSSATIDIQEYVNDWGKIPNVFSIILLMAIIYWFLFDSPIILFTKMLLKLSCWKWTLPSVSFLHHTSKDYNMLVKLGEPLLFGRIRLAGLLIRN